MEQAMTTEGSVEFGVLIDHVIDYVVDRVVAELAERLGGTEQVEPAEPAEPEPITQSCPADLHFEDEPAAIEEPRRQSGLPRDITGFVFGQFTAIERSAAPGYWLCRCSCGVHKDVKREDLKSGSARSCGCARLGLGPLRANTVDLMGQRFGRLTVIGRARSQNQMTTWCCRCLCGRLADCRGDLLRAGKRVSCGCADPSNKISMIGRRFGKLRVSARHQGRAGAKKPTTSAAARVAAKPSSGVVTCAAGIQRAVDADLSLRQGTRSARRHGSDLAPISYPVMSAFGTSC
jgi:hypothetical protein